MAVSSRTAESGDAPILRGPEDLRNVLRAWGRHQAALWHGGPQLLTEVDLTMAQFRALSLLRIEGPLTGKDLAGRLHVTPATLIPLIDRLESHGYVRRVPDQDDRRLTWIEPTAKSYRLFRRLWVGPQAKLLRAIHHLSPLDRKEFARLLNQVADHLSA
ncbi:MAG TPA: MarR family transcriptional regulator [Candidatus Dormibacteraeota bacterium]|nr:MarR family transcriptional regulator [Candidatus Dormibacteraeota bacterium]